ncbi:unnamed protein product [Macrosiphum euphorbiae]|nr:unnamed protein product [Macrosiphum euphorbiae]
MVDEYFDEFDVERIPKRYIRNIEDPFEKYNDNTFLKRYRFPKLIVMDQLLNLLGINYANNRGLPIPPILQLLTTLRFYATANFQTVCGDLRGIDQSTVSRIIKRVSHEIASRFRDHVKFPQTEAEWSVIRQQFFEIAGMPGVGGCIDCTHIKIQNPGGINGEVFRNRKGWFSLNVQLVCGPLMEIHNLVVRWPGSYHDSFIFNASHACAVYSNNNHNLILLGDNGYACKPYIFTPLLNPVTNAEKNYNKAHIKTRNIVERVFGVWKRKFPCLRRGLANSPNTIISIIVACAVLYNISLKLRLPDFAVEDETVEEVNNFLNDENREIIGAAARRAYIIRHFT